MTFRCTGEKCPLGELTKNVEVCTAHKCPYRTPPPSNADRIRAMSDEQLADFLSHLAYTREEPWSKPFSLKFCRSCPEPEYTLDDGRKIKLHECDFKDSKCPHGSDIVWWLNQSAEEAKS